VKQWWRVATTHCQIYIKIQPVRSVEVDASCEPLRAESHPAKFLVRVEELV
jgi:hypothetical protein